MARPTMRRIFWAPHCAASCRILRPEMMFGWRETLRATRQRRILPRCTWRQRPLGVKGRLHWVQHSMRTARECRPYELQMHDSLLRRRRSARCKELWQTSERQLPPQKTCRTAFGAWQRLQEIPRGLHKATYRPLPRGALPEPGTAMTMSCLRLGGRLSRIGRMQSSHQLQLCR